MPSGAGRLRRGWCARALSRGSSCCRKPWRGRRSPRPDAGRCGGGLLRSGGSTSRCSVARAACVRRLDQLGDVGDEDLALALELRRHRLDPLVCRDVADCCALSLADVAELLRT